jgi:hypothetical protein
LNCGTYIIMTSRHHACYTCYMAYVSSPIGKHLQIVGPGLNILVAGSTFLHKDMKIVAQILQHFLTVQFSLRLQCLPGPCWWQNTVTELDHGWQCASRIRNTAARVHASCIDVRTTPMVKPWACMKKKMRHVSGRGSRMVF